jgi:soluble lytic murein transglycosylase
MRLVYASILSLSILALMRPVDGYASTLPDTQVQSAQNRQNGAQVGNATSLQRVAVPNPNSALQAENFTITPTTSSPPFTPSPSSAPAKIAPASSGNGQEKYVGASQQTVQDFNSTLLALREASNSNDSAKAVELSSRLLTLSSFPGTSEQSSPFLRAYIEYFGIKPLLFDTHGSVRDDIPETTLNSVRAFLKRYAGNALADRMRNDYLLVLGAQKNWPEFENQYRLFVLNDDVRVKAYALAARAEKGENVAAAARDLLKDPRQYGDAGVTLIQVLAERKQWSAQDIWNQLRLTYQVNRQSMAKDIAPALGADAPASALLDEAALRPLALLNVNAANVPRTSMGAQLTLLALTKMARSDPKGAATAFAPIASRLTAQQQAVAWATIAYWGAIDHCPEALSWYQRATGAPMSDSAMEWRVRAALFSGSWKEVRQAIEVMPAALQARPAWMYWLARALEEQSNPVSTQKTVSSSPASSQDAALTQNQMRAKALFVKIASRFDFYGLLAREALGLPLVLPARTEVTAEQIAAMQQMKGFALTQRLYAAGLYFEGSREWNWMLRGMNDRQLLAAANYAQQIGLYDRVVSTADRTRQESDFALSYPVPSKEIIERNAQLANLDTRWVYGLIRQESRFLSKAQSGVGAVGYMQVMPRTAQLVARKIGLEDFDVKQLADIQTNTLIGTRYLAMLYDRFDRSAVLATAS